MLVRGGEFPDADAGCPGFAMPVPDLPAGRGAVTGRAQGMTRLARALAAAALVTLIPFVAPAASPSILGTWEIVEAAAAPWTKPEDHAALVAQGKGLLHTVITFAPHAVNSKLKLFTCKRRVAYESVELPVDTLFQGNLPEPNPTAAAARLGFPKGKLVPGVDVRCLKARFTFHFRDANTAMMQLNGVIYTLKRR